MSEKPKKLSSKRIALRQHVINQPPHYFVIKKGDDVDLSVPPRYIPTLIAEGVIKGDK